MEAVKSIPLYRGGQLHLVQSEISCFGSHCLLLAFSSRAPLWLLYGAFHGNLLELYKPVWGVFNIQWSKPWSAGGGSLCMHARAHTHIHIYVYNICFPVSHFRLSLELDFIQFLTLSSVGQLLAQPLLLACCLLLYHSILNSCSPGAFYSDSDLLTLTKNYLAQNVNSTEVGKR